MDLVQCSNHLNVAAPTRMAKCVCVCLKKKKRKKKGQKCSKDFSNITSVTFPAKAKYNVYIFEALYY